MKKNIFLLLLMVATWSYAQYPIMSIRSIQMVGLDSLKVADSIGIGGTTQWTYQRAPKYLDTVTIIALVTVPPKTITYTAGGRTLCLTDTGAGASLPWSGIFVRCGFDSSNADAIGFYNIERGDVIKITGRVNEFPTNNMNSFTQFEPIQGMPIEIISSGNPLPPPVHLSIAEFNEGANPGGKVKFSTGEQWEAREVMFTNLSIGASVNITRGTWQVVDVNGNTFSDYDWSYHFTLGHGGSEPVAGDPNYVVPPIGTKVDTLRGYISTSSGSESNRGYRICPIYPSDVVYGKIAPGLTSHRRTPVIVTKDSNATVTAKVFRQTSAVVSGAPLNQPKLVYSVNFGSWQEVTMTNPGAGDSISTGAIPKQAEGSVVRYFVKATDTDNQVTILANSGSLTQYDSTKGFFFYTVVDRSKNPVLSPKDVQTTIYNNGRSPYIGAIDSVGGIVTADTSALRRSALSAGGPSGYYIQSGNQPWSGLWLVGPDSIMLKMKMGDSVIVTGTISEFNDVTELFNITKGRIVSSGKPIPTPVKLKTERFGDAASNGNLDAEPYEGMLVQFDSVTVTSLDPVFSDVTEYWVSNSSASILVRREGKNKYSNVAADSGVGLTVLKVGDKFTSMIGVLHYSFGRYKVVPRTDADFVGYSPLLGVQINRNPGTPKVYALDQNYPNPFNPSTTVRYSIPNAGVVSLKVYNVIGQEVASLVNEYQTAGSYSVRFDASKLSTGMYLYKISSGAFTEVKKMLLVK